MFLAKNSVPLMNKNLKGVLKKDLKKHCLKGLIFTILKSVSQSSILKRNNQLYFQQGVNRL